MQLKQELQCLLFRKSVAGVVTFISHREHISLAKTTDPSHYIAHVLHISCVTGTGDFETEAAVLSEVSMEAYMTTRQACYLMSLQVCIHLCFSFWILNFR